MKQPHETALFPPVGVQQDNASGPFVSLQWHIDNCASDECPTVALYRRLVTERYAT